MTEKFDAQIVYLLPVLASLLFGLGCAYLLLVQPAPLVPVTPFPDETTSGPLGNALYFVLIVAVGAAVLYLLVKWKSRKLIIILIASALTAASMLLSVFYFSVLFASVPNAAIIVAALSIAVTLLVDLAIFRFGSNIRNTIVVCLGGALGVFFGVSIPLVSGLLILCFLAVYDIFAVYKGPVGKIAHAGLEQLKGLSFSFKDIQMGLGDLVFYSMLSASMLFNFGMLAYAASFAGILAGVFLTFVMLEKKGIFPGLPFPVFLGLAGGLLASLI
ncbi:MAG: presenilin [Candidatus Bathyarchaeota archaeon]|nr:presenilin [Candidatus Bathyarchaeota archaeon]